MAAPSQDSRSAIFLFLSLSLSLTLFRNESLTGDNLRLCPSESAHREHLQPP
ncbi:unnamed protein product [Protopolystoma xenopodis]|uniref:Uncharacterized protein n=1 Tax=Protopolystoma xenopodis TaxID=117903 RepID=A0A448XR22_9PLAT|nr:unnamed protein product [Protopolystoma xenopodis]